MPNTCGCKGIRSCYLCKPDLKKLQVNDKNKKCFYYCEKLKKCVAFVKSNDSYQLMAFLFPGVIIINDFINEKEEQLLVENINKEPWKMSQSGRSKQDFGPKINFKKKKVNCNSFIGLPCYSKELVCRIQNIKELSDFEPVEMCNLNYEESKGSSIDPHFDDEWLWGERLITINLLSDTYYTMTLPDSDHLDMSLIRPLDDEESCSLDLDFLKSNAISDLELESLQPSVRIHFPAKSLLVLKGEARTKWMHSICREDIKGQRMCSTFRELSEEFKKGKSLLIGEKLLKIASSYQGIVTL